MLDDELIAEVAAEHGKHSGHEQAHTPPQGIGVELSLNLNLSVAYTCSQERVLEEPYFIIPWLLLRECR